MKNPAGAERAELGVAMGAIFGAWAISGAALLILAGVLGLVATSRIDGILIDERGRYSLNHLQLVLWTIIILSLFSGVFFGRLVHGVADPLAITIPPELLGLFGIVAGSAVTATTVKRTKDSTRGNAVAASGGPDNPPRLAQIFLLEEGAFADKAVDIGKFQGFIVTIVFAVAYIAMAVRMIEIAGTAQAVDALPGFPTAFLTLLGISQGAYVTAKLPPAAGQPAGLVVQTRNQQPDQFRVMKRTASATH
jgi:hypothetical protein